MSQKIHIEIGAVVCSEAIFKGKHPIQIGKGTVIHPRAVIDAEGGPVSIGENTIVQEFATVRNARETPLIVGNANLLETFSQTLCSIGNCNLIEARCCVDLEAGLGDLNRVGCRVQLTRALKKNSGNVISYPHNTQEQPISEPAFIENHSRLVSSLQAQLPKFHNLKKV